MHFTLKITATVVFIAYSFGLRAQITYPETPRIPVVNTYHGTEVTDEYQWLELENNQEVKDWAAAQNEVSEKYLRKMLRSNDVEEQMNRFMFRRSGKYEGENLSSLAKNSFYFTMYYPDYETTPSLYYRKGFNGKDKVLINSDAISEKDEIILRSYSTSKDKQYLAYQYSRNGSDWTEIKVVEPQGRKHHPDLLTNTRNSGIYWLNNGFFYTRIPEASMTGKTVLPEIRYHVLGQEQAQDQLIFKTNDDKEFLSMFRASKEDLYVIRKEDFKKKTYSYYYLDPEKTQLAFRPLLLNIPYEMLFSHYLDGSLIALTSIENNTHLVSIPLETPQKLKVISPNYQDAVYKDHVIVENRVIMAYQGQENDILVLLDTQGNVQKELPLPAGLSVSDLDYREEFGEFLFSMESYTIPNVLYKLDLEKFEYEIVEQTQVNFDFKDYKFANTVFTSHDGTKIPIFIVYKGELKKDGSTPFLMKTYGGYGLLGSPTYEPGGVYFIENGGAFAYVHVRGGGKLGKDWWEGGQRLNKKNSYLDFVAAAEFLVQEGYSSPKNIAITGASHGGLVTAAAALTRPDLFGAAAVDVGVLDMLRFENFSVGATATNLAEFGSVENKEEFEYLYSYSPYHTIEEGTDYPSMLLLTGTHDNRVPPFHSYKFAARLQNNPGQKNPVLLWTQNQTGHSGATNMTDRLRENSFIYGFLFSELEKNQKEEL